MHVPWTWVRVQRRRAAGRALSLSAVVGGMLAAAWVCLPAGQVDAPTGPPCAEPAGDAERALSGIWWQEGADRRTTQRFYYFHGDGTGLFRYGAPGLTNTHSFDYVVRGDDLLLMFRKTGDRHVVRFSISEGPRTGTDRLELADDPRGHGSSRWVRTSDRTVGPRAGQEASFGRMWIDLRTYATGGRGFALYQLREPGIDGRGTGWFHRGDFDDWSTEALTYRRIEDELELTFESTGQTFSTTFAIEGEGDARVLRLDTDPRDYGLHHRYRDGGPSFGSFRLRLLGQLAAEPSSL
jgi:hypothetical protein